MWDTPKAPKAQKKSRAKANPLRPQRTELTADQVAEIRTRYAEGASIRSLAREHHCHISKISNLVADLERPVALSDPEEQEEVRRLYQQGMTIKDLAFKFNTNKSRVSQTLGDLVIKNNVPIKLTEEQENAIRRAYARNESIRSIATRLGIHRRIVYRVLGKGDMRKRTACPSMITVESKTYSCHLSVHSKGTHRTVWRDGEETQFRVEWQ